MRKIIKIIQSRLAVFFVLLVASIATASAADRGNLRSRVDATIKPILIEFKVPGMAVAITIDGQAHFFSYGTLANDKSTPVTEETIFEVGSVSKVFTATLTNLAQAQGKLSLDDFPSQHLPQLKGSPIDKARLFHLGTYTAGGLPLQIPDSVTHQNVLQYFRQFKATALAGTQRQYSNPSIGLLGYVTAAALKTDFAEAMEQQLFTKLGFTRSFIRVPENQMAYYAWGHNDDSKQVRVNPGVMDAQSYGVKSTAKDLLRFVQLNIDPRSLEAPFQFAVQQSQIGYFKVGKMVQGLGWEQYEYPVTIQQLLKGNSPSVIFAANPVKRITKSQLSNRAKWFNKTGSTGGFSSYVAFVPSEKIGIVLLANKNVPISTRIKAAHSIIEAFALPLK